MSKYTELFSIVYKHEYFSQAGFLGMKCCLSKQTDVLFKNMEIIVRPFEGGCRVFYDSDLHENYKDLYTMFADEKITFILYPVDKYNFYGYTMEFNRYESKEKHNSREGLLLFTINDKAIVSDAHIELAEAKYTLFGLPEFFPDQEIEAVKDAKEILRDEIDQFTLDEVCELRSRPFPQVPVVFKISTDQLKTFPEAPTFNINFKSTTTHYKYYMSMNERLKSDSLQVRDPEKHIEFERKQELLENGNEILVFLSKSAIKSEYKSKQYFELVDDKSGSPQIIMKKMPMPKPGSYFTDKVNGVEVMVSEIFIN